MKNKIKIILSVSALAGASALIYSKYQKYKLTNPHRLLKDIKIALYDEGTEVSDAWIVCELTTFVHDSQELTGFNGGVSTPNGSLNFFIEKGTGNLFILD